MVLAIKFFSLGRGGTHPPDPPLSAWLAGGAYSSGSTGRVAKGVHGAGAVLGPAGPN